VGGSVPPGAPIHWLATNERLALIDGLERIVFQLPAAPVPALEG
jgi:hypothetical protein